MIRHIFKQNKLKHKNTFVEPDEIFLDSKNLQNFDRQQFEGRIEKPISKRSIFFLGFVFILFSTIFGVRLGYLQIQKGEAYYKRSENNTLEKVVIFAERGIIYDRNKVELAWNKKVKITPDVTNASLGQKQEGGVAIRAYLANGFSHLVGYVSYPALDKMGNYWQSEFIGKDGLEKQYSDRLKGVNGSKMVEVDAKGEVHSENTVNAPKIGVDLVTTIDSRIQKQLFTFIENLSKSNNFAGGAGVLININNGEILTSTSYPEYNSETLSQGKETAIIKGYINDKRKIFMDRIVSGLYTPGSIVKPFFALGALNEGVIDAHKQILSTGSISIPNPYFPEQKTIFKDWRANGWADMARAIAVSHDVYFYEIGGGYQDQKGLGILNLGKYAKLFGIGQKTGIDLPDEKGGTIPSPEWKLKNFKGDAWRIGDTYHTAIGQYGFQVTPLEIVRATAAIANGGKLVTPHFILGDTTKETATTVIDMKKEYFDVVRGGMRDAVSYGTAVALNVPYVQVAAKTGTAQLGIAKNKVNSWIIGFFPYENPKYAFTIMMEAGPSTNGVGASAIMRQTLDWMSINTPEYFK